MCLVYCTMTAWRVHTNSATHGWLNTSSAKWTAVSHVALATIRMTNVGSRLRYKWKKRRGLVCLSLLGVRSLSRAEPLWGVVGSTSHFHWPMKKHCPCTPLEVADLRRAIKVQRTVFVDCQLAYADNGGRWTYPGSGLYPWKTWSVSDVGPSAVIFS